MDITRSCRANFRDELGTRDWRLIDMDMRLLIFVSVGGEVL